MVSDVMTKTYDFGSEGSVRLLDLCDDGRS